MKLPGDPWNNRWSSFYGIAWNFSMEFHRKCPNPPWKMSMHKFPWNPMEISALMFSMEFHGKCPNPPCKYLPWKPMEKFPWNSMEIDVLILHGIPWRIFHGNPWISMEFHGGISHGIAWGKFQKRDASFRLVLNRKASVRMVCSAQHHDNSFTTNQGRRQVFSSRRG